MLYSIWWDFWCISPISQKGLVKFKWLPDFNLLKCALKKKNIAFHEVDISTCLVQVVSNYLHSNAKNCIRGRSVIFSVWCTPLIPSSATEHAHRAILPSARRSPTEQFPSSARRASNRASVSTR